MDDIVRRDILWGCARCPDVGYAQARNTEKTIKNTLQSHIESHHPEVSDWLELKVHGGFKVRSADGTIYRIPYQGNETLQTLHKNRGRSATPARSSTPARTGKTITPPARKSRAKKKGFTKSPLSETIVGADLEVDEAILGTSYVAASETLLNADTNNPIDRFNSNSDQVQVNTDGEVKNSIEKEDITLNSLQDVLEQYDNTRRSFEANMARYAGSSPAVRSLPNVATYASSSSPIMLPTEVKLSTFDQEAVKGVHGLEFKNLCENGLMMSAEAREGISRDEQWFNLAAYLAERGNCALKEHGAGLVLPIVLERNQAYQDVSLREQDEATIESTKLV